MPYSNRDNGHAGGSNKVVRYSDYLKYNELNPNSGYVSRSYHSLFREAQRQNRLSHNHITTTRAVGIGVIIGVIAATASIISPAFGAIVGLHLLVATAAYLFVKITSFIKDRMSSAHSDSDSKDKGHSKYTSDSDSDSDSLYNTMVHGSGPLG